MNFNFRTSSTTCNAITTRHFAESDDTFLNDFWRHPKQPTPPFWRPFSRACKPLHFVLDKILEIANRKLGKDLEARPTPSMLSDLNFATIGHKLCAFTISEQIRQDMPELSEGDRKLRFDLINWVQKDTTLRIKACEQRVKSLDNYSNYAPPTQDRPNWRPEPAVADYLKLAQNWAEQTHLSKKIPTSFPIPPIRLTVEQLNELSIGLSVLIMYFNLRKVEVSCAEHIDQRHRANGLVKLALVLALATPFALNYKLPFLATSLISLGGASWQNWLVLKTSGFHNSSRCKLSIIATNLSHAIYIRTVAMRRAQMEGRPFREEDVMQVDERDSPEDLEDTGEADLAERLRSIRAELAQMRADERRREDELRQNREIYEDLERQRSELLRERGDFNSRSQDLESRAQVNETLR